MYTTHCPQCNVLARKMTQKNIQYTEIDDIKMMLELGIKTAPMLSIDNGTPMNFKEAINWINSLEV